MNEPKYVSRLIGKFTTNIDEVLQHREPLEVEDKSLVLQWWDNWDEEEMWLRLDVFENTRQELFEFGQLQDRSQLQRLKSRRRLLVLFGRMPWLSSRLGD
jgi:adenylate kinase family enzyme